MSNMTIKARLNLKIESELKDWAMDYAKKRGTNLTKLICVYLNHLREQEEHARKRDVVEQI